MAYLVSQARPNQLQRASLSISHTGSDPCCGWLGLACETNGVPYAMIPYAMPDDSACQIVGWKPKARDPTVSVM